ncbi:MAG: hypothetical protein EXR72_12855 [Myxococcales bacterium]|nr:hypothetical protein [Myxococcales bacterium]
MRSNFLLAALFVGGAGGASLAFPLVAHAEDSAAPPKVKVERSASGQKIFRITEGIVVEGRIQKPNAFYVLQRSSIDYDWETLKQDFLPRVLEATSHHPF